MSMYCVTVSYPATPGKRFDLGYYVETHIPLCDRLFARYGYYGHVLRIAGASKPGADDGYLAELDLFFRSKEELLRALEEQAGAITADVAHFTNIEPRMLFAEAAASLELRATE